MQITVLGSSADKGFPNIQGRDRRTRSSIALKIGSRYIIFDAGPDFWRQLKREGIGTGQILAVLLTHAHPDHVLGLDDRPIKFDVFACQKVWQELGKSKIAAQYQKIISPAIPFSLEKFEFQFLSINHSPRYTTYGILVGINGKSNLFYAPDLKSIPASAIKKIKVINTLILDGSILNRDLNVHASIKKQLKWCQKFKVTRIYFTHIGRNPAKLGHEGLIKYLKALDPRADVLYDGQHLTI